MDQIINDEIPHVAKRIFKKVNIDTLVHCLHVSKTWNNLASSVFWCRWQEVENRRRSILILACSFGYTSLVKALSMHHSKADEVFKEKGGFWHACQNGHMEVVQYLLRYSKLNGIPIEKEAIIKEFCHKSQILKVLLRQWGLKNTNGTKLFTWAVQKGSIDIVQVLLDHPKSKSINFNTKKYFRYQKTPLMIASSFGYFEIVKLLIEHSTSHKINLNAKDVFGKTAFSLACGWGHVETVKCILDKAPNTNLDLNSMDNYGRTALGNACTNLHHYDGCYEVAEILHMLPNIE